MYTWGKGGGNRSGLQAAGVLGDGDVLKSSACVNQSSTLFYPIVNIAGLYAELGGGDMAYFSY